MKEENPRWKWLTLTLWWSALLGLMLPRTPSQAWPTALGLILSMLVLLSVLLLKQTRQTIKETVQKLTKTDSTPVALPLVSLSAFAVATLKVFSKDIPKELMQFTLLTVVFVWGWLEITLRTAIYLRRSFSYFHSLALVIGVSLIGITIGWMTHLSLHGNTLSPLLILLISGGIFAGIPFPSLKRSH